MKAAYHVDFSNAEWQGFADHANDFLDGIFKGVRIAFPRRKGTKLTGKNADVGVVNIAIVNITSVVPILTLAHDVCHYAKRVQIVRLVQTQPVGVANTLTRFNFFGNGPERVGN